MWFHKSMPNCCFIFIDHGCCILCPEMKDPGSEISPECWACVRLLLLLICMWFHHPVALHQACDFTILEAVLCSRMSERKVLCLTFSRICANIKFFMGALRRSLNLSRWSPEYLAYDGQQTSGEVWPWYWRQQYLLLYIATWSWTVTFIDMETVLGFLACPWIFHKY